MLLNDDFRLQTTVAGSLLPGAARPVAIQLEIAAASGTHIKMNASGDNVAVSNDHSRVEIASAMVSTEMLPIIDEPLYGRVLAMCGSSATDTGAKLSSGLNVAIEIGSDPEDGFLCKVEAEEVRLDKSLVTERLRVILFPDGGPEVLSLAITGEKILQAIEILMPKSKALDTAPAKSSAIQTESQSQNFVSASSFECTIGQETRVKLIFSMSYTHLKSLVRELVAREMLEPSYCGGFLSLDGIIFRSLLRVVSWVLPPVIPLILEAPKCKLPVKERGLNMPEDAAWLEKEISPIKNKMVKSLKMQFAWALTKRLAPLLFIGGSICMYTLGRHTKVGHTISSKAKDFFNYVRNNVFKLVPPVTRLLEP